MGQNGCKSVGTVSARLSSLDYIWIQDGSIGTWKLANRLNKWGLISKPLCLVHPNATRLRDASFGNQNNDVINPFSISTLLFLKCPEGIV